MTQPYVYEIEHIESGKKYIGSRTANGCDPEELLIMEGYLTSSKIVNGIIEKEGNAAFKINSIEIFENSKDARNRETEKLLEVDARNNEEYLNLHNNEFDINFQKFLDFHDVDNVSRIPEIAKKISESRIKYFLENPEAKVEISKRVEGENNPNYGKSPSEETKNKLRDAGKRKIVSDETKRKISEANKGVSKSEEHKKKLSEANKGKNLSEQTKEKISESEKLYWKTHQHPKGMLGKKHKVNSLLKISEANKGVSKSEDHKRKISETLKGVKQEIVICPNCGKEGGIRQMKRYHFDNCKEQSC